jgi:parallel beta-helix repeat protein
MSTEPGAHLVRRRNVGVVIAMLIVVAAGCKADGSFSAAGPPIDVPTSASAKCPPGAVDVGLEQSIQAAIDARPPGTTFCIRSGERRLAHSIRPKSNNTLVFEQGSILNGSVLVKNWAPEGARWVATGMTQSFSPYDVPCELNRAACEYEDLFMDDKPLVRVLNLSELAPGKFFFDEGSDKMYVAEDPSGRKMEAPVTKEAIHGSDAEKVTVRGATIEKFAVNGIAASDGWTIQRNEIRYVHSHGLRVFGTTVVKRNYIHHTGNMGIFGSGTNMLFERNHLAYNNYLNFGRKDGPWHAGATKIVKSDGTIVRENYSHDNIGDGWWFDTDNINTLVEGNVFENNTRYGFFYETSFKAVVRNNEFTNNGTPEKWAGAGLWISNSKDMRIHDNVFSNNKYSALAMSWVDRGSSPLYGPYEVANVFVHDNVIRMADGFVGVPFAEPKIYSSNNRFEGNRYVVADPDGQWWDWQGGRRTWEEWRSLGFDTTGSVSPIPERN